MNQTTPLDPDTLPKPILPSWVFDRPAAEGLEEAVFSSGAALALLHGVLGGPDLAVPLGLLRTRLALRAAVCCGKIEGRGVTEAALRDATLLTSPGDAMGPDGDMLAFWRAGAAISVKHAGWRDRLLDMVPRDMRALVSDGIAEGESGQGNPVARAVSLLSALLQAFPQQEAAALLCADTVLARSLGWERALPLFGLRLPRKALRDLSAGEDRRMACYAAVSQAAQEATRLAQDLARRAARLRAVTPKLRSKGSAAAVQLFLSEEAVLPSTMLSPIIRGSGVPMTPRSARRLCERLVELGVVRELTGRAVFRLYGVA